MNIQNPSYPNLKSITLIISAIVLFVTSAFGVYLYAQENANAASAADWRAGRIIDDVVFYNSGEMSTQDIQTFLNQLVPNCDTSGTQRYSTSMSNAQYAASRGWPGPAYVCLKDYYQIPRSDQNINNLTTNIIPTGAISSASIIKLAADTYNVNPKAILVLLEKESLNLLKDNWPLPSQYKNPMGYGCPDTAPCDPKYEGFYNQVMNAARQFKIYKDDPGSYRHKASQDNSILYQANSSTCGSSVVFIQTQATAGLYNYTPYQPNQAALNNLYGTGDACSAYGNRNFWRIYTDWFGTTQAPNYAAQYVSQSAYPTLAPNQQTTTYIEFRNAGNQNWYDDVAATANGKKPVRLATMFDVNRASNFSSQGWIANNRPSGTFTTVYDANSVAYSTNPHIVKPGESVRISFNLSTPDMYPANTYTEVFTLIEEGGVGVISMPIFPAIKITVPEVVNSLLISQTNSSAVKPGETKSGNFIIYKNTGNTTWYDDTSVADARKPTRLATMNPVNRSSTLSGGHWGSNNNRPAGTFQSVYKNTGEPFSDNPHAVKPGEYARYEFNFTAPDNSPVSTTTEYFGLVEEGGVGVITSPGTAAIPVSVSSASTAKPAAAQPSTESLAQTNSLERTYQFKNTGNTTWAKSTTQLRVTSGSSDGIRSTNWISDTVASGLNESSIAPGQVGTFTTTYTATGNTGSKNIELSVFENGEKISLSPVKVDLTITVPVYKAGYVSQSEYPIIQKNSTATSSFRFKNIGDVSWYDSTTAPAANTKPIVLAATEPINRISPFNANFITGNRPTAVFSKVLESDGLQLSADQHKANPGQIVEFSFTLTVPDSVAPGTYREYFQPIVEGGDPWDMKQPAWTSVTVPNTNHEASYYSQSGYPTIQKGSTAPVSFMFKNSGQTAWYDTSSAPKGIAPVTLAATQPINRLSVFRSAFDSENRPLKNFSAVYESNGTTLATNQHVVQPGQTAKYTFTLSAPSNIAPGTYREYFQPILEGSSSWNLKQTVWLDVFVQ